MDLIQLRRNLLFKKKESFPDEYQKVEYIKTQYTENGTRQIKSFITTNISYSNISKIECKYSVIKFTGSQKAMFITSHANGSGTPDSPFATVENVSGFASVTPTISKPYTNNPIIYTINMGNSMPSNKSIRIGGWSDVAWTAEGAYYYVDVYGNSKKLYSFVPCYRKSDNKAGFYEIINKSFYASNGELDFIAGPNA